MKIYQIQVRRYDRRDGLSDWQHSKETSSSASSAVSRAIKDYIKGLTPKEKRDAAKQIEVRCTYLGQQTEKMD